MKLLLLNALNLRVARLTLDSFKTMCMRCPKIVFVRSHSVFVRVFVAVASFAEASAMAARDALALARLYAVKTLTQACGDAAAAQAWLKQQSQLPLSREDTEVKGLIVEGSVVTTLVLPKWLNTF